MVLIVCFIFYDKLDGNNMIELDVEGNILLYVIG